MNNSSNSILLVGAGQLGSRHLQGLARVCIPVSISVVDPSNASLKTAWERFAEMESNSNITEINFHTDILEAPDSIDLAVIATGANVRADVLANLVATKQVRNIVLEKFLFQNESDFEIVGELLHKHHVNAFVNCPRRLYPFYRELKTLIQGKSPITLNVDGSNWGLGCNIIHFLDLFAFLTGNCSIEFDDLSLDSSIQESKRPGFVEFTGTVKGGNARGDRFEITSDIDLGSPIRITIGAGNRRIEISESAGSALFFENAAGTETHETFTVPYQSQLTGEVAQEILMNGTCGLTTYDESMQLHLPVLKTLLEHLNKVSGKQYTHCPIT